jgi:hypothetical protein
MSTLMYEHTNTIQTGTFTPIAGRVLQRQCACGKHTIAGGECEVCRQKREGMMQRAAVNSAPVSAVPPIVHDGFNSPGQPRFGHDFSSVKISAQPQAGVLQPQVDAGTPARVFDASTVSGGVPAEASPPPVPAQEAEDPRVISREGGPEEHIDPGRVPKGIWWFNGATPTLSDLYPNEADIALGLPNGGRFHFSITKGSDKLRLLDGHRQVVSLAVKDTPKLRVKGIGPSKTTEDIQLKIIHTPPGGKSSDTITGNLEVRAPNHLDLLGCASVAKGTHGYETSFRLKVWDNFGAPMPYMDVNEDFTAGKLASGTSTEWAEPIHTRSKGSSITLGDAIFEDQYRVVPGSDNLPASMTPKPGNPQSPLGHVLVASFTHDWYVGSRNTGQGVHVSRHIGKFYADHGQYSGFTSPVSSHGKASSCPEEAARK